MEVPETLPAEPDSHDGELKELKAPFRRMIYSLPEPYREALVLAEFDGLTQQELPECLNISLSGAKSRVQRGRDRREQTAGPWTHRKRGPRIAGSKNL